MSSPASITSPPPTTEADRARRRRRCLRGRSRGMQRSEDRRLDGEVVLVGAELRPPYDRPPLTKHLLCGAAEPKDIGLVAGKGLDQAELVHRRGCCATGLDPERAIIELEGKE